MEIVLRERAAGDSRILEWEPASQIGDPHIGDRLVVCLAKAEEITLELSTFLKADFLDHFAINSDLVPAESGAAASAGRHPMVTPVRSVTLTHAVRRPLSDPHGTLKPRRDPDQTFVVLDPDPKLLEVDPKSTAQLEIVGTWDEQTDNGIRHVTETPVQIVTVNRGDQFLQDVIRHEFGDTRHRKVTYTLRAISRFQQFFDGENDSAFVASAVLPTPVSIPSSARPSPPIVLSTRPAFVWEEDRQGNQDFVLHRRRLGGYLRVELKGPWYKTGEGEQLAVLVWRDKRPPEEIWPFITQAGRDPIQKTHDPDRWPAAADFTRPSGPSRDVFLKEAGREVIIVPYEPWFQESKELSGPEQSHCFVDIAIPHLVTESYRPFVQLAVARYQPNSLEGLEISAAVRTEMVQLLPERNLSVKREGNSVLVLLDGIDKDNTWSATLEQFQSPAGVGADSFQLTALEAPTDGIPAWVPVTNRLSTKIGRPMEIQLQQALGPVRIRIQEMEVIGGDVPGQVTIPGVLKGRTVYSDLVLLQET